jgi:iron-regulated transporter 1
MSETSAAFPTEVSFLYASYFFAAWGDRMWEFAAIVFLLEIFPDTLFPASLFGFAECLAGIIMGPQNGAYIDTTDRLRVLRTSIIGQNSVIFVASLVFAIAIAQGTSWSYAGKGVVMVIITIAGMIAKVSSSLNKVSIHKDWCVVMAKKNAAWQTQINASMRRVDLSCNILAPMLVGVLSAVITPTWTCVVIALWASCSVVAEWHIASMVYNRVPALQGKRNINSAEPTQPANMSIQTWFDVQLNAARAYSRHIVLPISVSYAMLYLSVLSLGGIMITYIRTLGVADLWLAVARGGGALVAIGSTFAVPWMINNWGLAKAGKVAIWSQVACLAPLVALFVFVPSQSSQKHGGFIIVIFLCLAASRFGLWGFDLAQTQLMQQLVDPAHAGIINSTQETVVNIFWLVSFALTMIFHDPTNFLWPVIISFSAVLFAGMLFTMRVDLVLQRPPDQNEDETVELTVPSGITTSDELPLGEPPQSPPEHSV